MHIASHLLDLMHASCLSFWIALLGVLASSCTPPEPAPSSDAPQRNTPPVLQTALPVPHSVSSTPDSTALAPAPDSAAWQARLLVWRQLEPTALATETFLPLRQFEGDAIGESVALFQPLDSDTIKLYVDYFEGDLVGSKVFYAAQQGLLAVDVHEMQLHQTEEGDRLYSKLVHTFCYDNGTLWQHWTHPTPSSANVEVLTQENLKDWAIIRPLLQQL